MFDEATSALDRESEKVVQKTINKVLKGATSLVVAHRIATIKDSDVICVMGKGELIEKGNYQELMARKMYFYELASV